MAKVKLIFTIAMVTALLGLAYGTISTEGRALQTQDNSVTTEKFNSVDTHIDAFRPTSPGHSPGGGHPIGLARKPNVVVDAFRPATPGPCPGIGNSIGLTRKPNVVVDAFRPTTPGHSPGAGNSIGLTRKPDVGVDAFRPTTPGHSPGAGN